MAGLIKYEFIWASHKEIESNAPILKLSLCLFKNNNENEHSDEIAVYT